MYEKLSDADIEVYQKTNTAPTRDDITLKDLVMFYEKELLPYRFTYECEHGLKVSFVFEDENLCHLLFGTIDRSFPKRKEYVGKLGYENLKNGIVTLDNLPSKIKNKSIHRILNFILIKKVLQRPNVIYFNKNLVKQDGKKYLNTDINAKFLLDRELTDNKHVHLFLCEVGKSQKLVPNSFFPNDSENYVMEQLSLKVKDIIIKSVIDEAM